MKKTVQTYLFEGMEDSNQYVFSDEIQVGIYDGLKITVDELMH